MLDLAAIELKAVDPDIITEIFRGRKDLAALIGKEIGIPDLKCVRYPAGDLKNVLLKYGFSEGAASDYVEMFTTLDKGQLFDDFTANRHVAAGVSIEAFAKQFAARYKKS